MSETLSAPIRYAIINTVTNEWLFEEKKLVRIQREYREYVEAETPVVLVAVLEVHDP